MHRRPSDRRARTASQPRATTAKADALDERGTAGGAPPRRITAASTRMRPSTGSRAVSHDRRRCRCASEVAATDPGDQPEQPGQDEQRTVTVDGRQRGQQVLPARRAPGQSVGAASGARGRRPCPSPSAGDRSAEHEEHDGEQEHRGDERPAGARTGGSPRAASTAPSIPDHQEAPAGEGGGQAAERDARQHQHEHQVTTEWVSGTSRGRGRERVWVSTWLIAGSRGAGRRGLPWRRGAGRGGRRSR